MGRDADTLRLNDRRGAQGGRDRVATRHRRRLPDQFHFRDHRAAQVRRAHPEPLALLPPEGRRQRAADVRRHLLAGHTNAVRLRNMDQPHHPDLPRCHLGDPGAVHHQGGVRGDSPAQGHRVVLCQYAIDDADGRPRVPRLRPELAAGRVRRRRGVAVSARRRVRGTHRREDSAVLRLERNRPAERDHVGRPAATTAAHRRPDRAGNVGAPLRRRSGRHRRRDAANRRAGDRRRVSATSGAPTTTSCSPATGGCGWAISARSMPTVT